MSGGQYSSVQVSGAESAADARRGCKQAAPWGASPRVVGRIGTLSKGGRVDSVTECWNGPAGRRMARVASVLHSKEKTVARSCGSSVS